MLRAALRGFRACFSFVFLKLCGNTGDPSTMACARPNAEEPAVQEAQEVPPEALLNPPVEADRTPSVPRVTVESTA